MPTGRSVSKISSFRRLFIPPFTRLSQEMNSVYVRSAPLALQTTRKGGSLTSSMGASRRGKSRSEISPIFTMYKIPFGCKDMPKRPAGRQLQNCNKVYRQAFKGRNLNLLKPNFTYEM